MKKVSVKEIVIKASIIMLVLLLDFVSKVATDGKVTVLINNVLSFSSHHNFGAAFSIFNNSVLFLIIVSIVFLSVFIVYDFFDKQKNVLSYVCFALIFAGALGNLVDRIALGYVRDFISLDFINFAVFNVADAALTCGVVLYCINLIFIVPKKKKVKNNEEN